MSQLFSFLLGSSQLVSVLIHSQLISFPAVSAILLSARVISVHLSSSQLFSFLSPLVLHVGKADILTSKLLLASGSTHVAKDPSVSQIVRITFSVGVYLRKKHMCFYLFMFFF